MSSIIMIKGSEPPTPEAGSVVIFADLGTGILRYKKSDGTVADLVGQNDPESKSITIEIPSNSELIDFFSTDAAITVYKMMAILRGTAPDLTWTVRHGTNPASGSEIVTGGTQTSGAGSSASSVVTTFDDATIVADSYIWIETTAKSGVVTTFALTLFFNED